MKDYLEVDLKLLHWTKIPIRIPSKIFLQIKLIYKKETF